MAHSSWSLWSDSPDSDLTPLGEKQARQTAQRLIGSGNFTILSSPLVRALGTASIIAETLDTSVEVWPDLREGHSGTHHAYSRQELLQHFPRSLLPADFAIDGWEFGNDTYESVLLRCQQSLRQLRERFTHDEQVIVVTHGGFANYLLHYIVQFSSPMPLWFEMDYCAISRVHFVPEQERESWPLYPAVDTKILCVNDCSHLAT